MPCLFREALNKIRKPPRQPNIQMETETRELTLCWAQVGRKGQDNKSPREGLCFVCGTVHHRGAQRLANTCGCEGYDGLPMSLWPQNTQYVPWPSEMLGSLK